MEENYFCDINERQRKWKWNVITDIILIYFHYRDGYSGGGASESEGGADGSDGGDITKIELKVIFCSIWIQCKDFLVVKISNHNIKETYKEENIGAPQRF